MFLPAPLGIDEAEQTRERVASYWCWHTSLNIW